jgi:hypothetical protein
MEVNSQNVSREVTVEIRVLEALIDPFLKHSLPLPNFGIDKNY